MGSGVRSARSLLALLLLLPWLAARADTQAGPERKPIEKNSAVKASSEKNSPDAWLERLAHSSTQLSYRGVLTYERGDHLESLRVTHGLVGGDEYERLEHLDGDPREVIRRGEQLTCVYLGQHLSRLFQRQHLLKNGLAGLEPYYELQTAGESRVAGRHAVSITIKPRDDYRFGYRLALDYDTGLLLRSELVGPEGRVLERFQFVDLQIQPLKAEWVAAVPDQSTGPVGNATTVAAAPVGAPGWSPQWLPPGFVLSLPPRHAQEDVLTFSDGLAVMSVFIEAANDPVPAAEGRARQGATVAYTRPLRTQNQSGKDQAFIVTVVGEVPQATAERVANSVDMSAQ